MTHELALQKALIAHLGEDSGVRALLGEPAQRQPGRTERIPAHCPAPVGRLALDALEQFGEHPHSRTTR